MNPSSALDPLPAAARILLSHALDYAGLFPPARLDMAAALQEFMHLRESPEAWALGRFLLPAKRWPDFERELCRHSAMHADFEISLIFDSMAELQSCPPATPQHFMGRITAVEMKESLWSGQIGFPSKLDQIPQAQWIEITPGDDLSRKLHSLKQTGKFAKLRCGGLTPEAFPSTEAVADFILAAAQSDIAWKATAGLHHAIRSRHSPDLGQPACMMHGYLNLFLAAALAWDLAGKGIVTQATRDKVRDILEENDPQAFTLNDDGALWRGLSIGNAVLLDSRQKFLSSFGTCSFLEPMQELRRLLPQFQSPLRVGN